MYQLNTLQINFKYPPLLYLVFARPTVSRVRGNLATGRGKREFLSPVVQSAQRTHNVVTAEAAGEPAPAYRECGYHGDACGACDGHGGQI